MHFGICRLFGLMILVWRAIQTQMASPLVATGEALFVLLEAVGQDRLMAPLLYPQQVAR